MSADIKITKLVYPETIRQNVGMYLGETKDYTTPLREIINNSEDEILNNHATWMLVVNKDNAKMVVDNGRGLPIYEDPDHPGRVIAHSTFTDVHSGSKFDNPDEVTSGIHGVGSSAVNAVSARYCVAVNLKKKDLSKTTAAIRAEVENEKLNNPILYIEYQKGLLVADQVLDGVESLKNVWGEDVPEDFSTAVFMVPDTDIYQSGRAKVSMLPIQIILQDKPNVRITVDGVEAEPYDFAKSLGDEVALFEETTLNFEYEHNSRLKIKGVFGFDTNTMNYNHTSLINLIENPEGGLIERVVTRALGESFKKLHSALTPSDIRMGFNLFTSSFSSYKKSFGSQTKEKLVSLGLPMHEALSKLKLQGLEETPENLSIYTVSEGEIRDGLIKFFDKFISKNKAFFELLAARVIEYKRQMNRLSSMDFVKSKVIMGDESDRKRSNIADAAKVYEASSSDWKRRELYLTEGLSASGGLIKFRDKQLQSILPLRGKILNCSTMEDVDLVSNGELLAVINTVGCGLGELADITKSRYGKIIIATDSDSDGSHIANLILAIFLIHARPLVEAGMVYKLTPPYYHVKTGKEEAYYSHAERDLIDFNKSTVTKRKGLGSYSPDEVKKFMVNPSTRCLTQITLDSVDEDTLKQAISLLYSSAARKKLMIETGVLRDEE
jgi:topoisomerase-4 subunit B